MKYGLHFLWLVLFCTAAQASTAYDSLINEASATYGVDAALIKSVIRAESGFNPNAESGVGAQGLMQLMPATAAELGVSDSLDPRDNIMGGTLYLSQLLGRYDGNPVLALAAYNAGMGRVDEYGGVPPYEETVTYITRISGYLSEYGAGALSLAGLPTSFVTSPSGGSSFVSEIPSLPEFSTVLAAFEGALGGGLTASGIHFGLQGGLIVILLIWMAWHLIFLVGEIGQQRMSLYHGFVYAVRGLVLMMILASFTIG